MVVMRIESGSGAAKADIESPTCREMALAINRLETDGGLLKDYSVQPKPMPKIQASKMSPAKRMRNMKALRLPPSHAEICRLLDDGCPQAALDV